MELVEEAPITIVLATHSTAFLAAAGKDARLAFMRYGEHDLTFSTISYTHKRILPVFGAHPLSNVFNEAPVLLVEGDDDERIWQQAVRSAEGRIAVYPVSVDSVTRLAEFEREVARILEAVYDHAIGYSIRDRDTAPDDALEPVGAVTRFRLNCRAAENLILTDEVLISLDLEWRELCSRIERWMVNNESHPHAPAFRAFIESDLDRRNADLKELRNDLVGLMGSNKPWEVSVGQAIAACSLTQSPGGPESIASYLGRPAYQTLVLGKAGSVQTR